MSTKAYTCGVPELECSGGKKMVGSSMEKLHGGRDEAFKCHVRYLLSQGFTRQGQREFKNPENGRIRVLTKKSRFGQVFYYTKEKTRYMRPHGKQGHVAGV